jgi:hypothetical protein
MPRKQLRKRPVSRGVRTVTLGELIAAAYDAAGGQTAQAVRLIRSPQLVNH